MKKSLVLFVITILGLSNFVYSQNKSSFGINGGLAIPTGKLSDSQELGFQFGGIGRIVTGSPTVMVAIGASYTMLSGKKEDVTLYAGPSTFVGTIEYESFKPFNVFVGPQFGKEKGIYFLPAITGNFEEDWTRFGIDIGAGALIPVGTGKTKVDLSVKFSLMNLIGKEEGEESASVFRILAGLTF